MTNKLCCTLNPFFKNRNKRYCLSCFKNSIRTELQKKIDWNKAPYWIADAQKKFLEGDCSRADDWQEVLTISHPLDDNASDIIHKIIGDVGDVYVEEAWGIYDELLCRAANRVKIVVE